MDPLSEKIYNFIQEVERFGELYDKNHKYFNHSKRKEAVWKGLSAKYKLDAKVKWLYLRERYSREKKKALRSGDEASFRSTWNFYPCLHFLEKHIRQRERKPNFNLPPVVKSNHARNRPQDITDKDIEEIFRPYDLMTTKRDSLPWSDDESHEATNDSTSLAQNDEIEINAKEEMPQCEFLDFGQPQESPKSKILKEENTSLSSVDIFQTTRKSTTINSTQNDEGEDWHFLQSLKYKMRKMHDEDKTRFKIEMLLQADKAVFNSRKKC